MAPTLVGFERFCKFFWGGLKLKLFVCMPSNFSCFCCPLLTFVKFNFFKKFFQKKHMSSLIWIAKEYEIVLFVFVLHKMDLRDPIAFCPLINNGCERVLLHIL